MCHKTTNHELTIAEHWEATNDLFALLPLLFAKEDSEYVSSYMGFLCRQLY